jgi:hypothetical protein
MAVAVELKFGNKDGEMSDVDICRAVKRDDDDDNRVQRFKLERTIR